MADAGSYSGAKLAILCKGRVLTMMRDDRPDIVYPGQWDLAGGMREGDETPQECALRELGEEFGLHLSADAIEYGMCYEGVLPGQGATWFFGAELPNLKPADISFGNEGQKWLLMPVRMYLMHPKAIPHLAKRLAIWLEQRTKKRV